MKNEKLKLMFSEEQIADRVKQLGQEISLLYTDGKPLLCICVLKGAALFFADLVRKIDCDNMLIDFVMLSSYGDGRTSSGTVVPLGDLLDIPANHHVLIVEDIIDTGITLKFLKDYISQKNPLSMRSVCLLKRSIEGNEASVDFCGFCVDGSDFMVGYGLDSNQKYRNLGGIYSIS